MGAFIASDDDAVTLRIRELLLRDGMNCPASRVETLDSATGILSNIRTDLAIVVLSPHPERGLATLRQLRSRTKGYVLAVGPIGDSMMILRAIREGADEYLNEADLDTELEGAMLRLASGRSSYREPGRITVLLGPNGGCGVSTVAVNLAAALTRKHNRAALIDLQLVSGDLASLLNLKPAYTLADVCLNVAQLDLGSFDRTLCKHASGIHLLAAPQAYGEVEHVTLQGVRMAVNMARDRFEHVVIDLNHNLSHEQADVLHLADQVLVVYRLEFNSLRNAFRTLEYLDELGVSRQRVKTVVNRQGQPNEVSLSKAESVLGQAAFQVLPDDPRIVSSANNEGLPAVLRAPRSRFSRAMFDMTKKIEAALGPPITAPESSQRKAPIFISGANTQAHSGFDSSNALVSDLCVRTPDARGTTMLRRMGTWLSGGSKAGRQDAA